MILIAVELKKKRKRDCFQHFGSLLMLWPSIYFGLIWFLFCPEILFLKILHYFAFFSLHVYIAVVSSSCTSWDNIEISVHLLYFKCLKWNLIRYYCINFFCFGYPWHPFLLCLLNRFCMHVFIIFSWKM